MKPIILFLITVISLSNWGFSQNVGISAGGEPTDNSAGLDISFQDKGLLIPRVLLASTTDVVTIVAPATSLLVYNTNADMVNGSIGYWYWNGAIWTKLLNGNSTPAAWSLAGNAGTAVGTNFLGTTDAQDFAIYTNNAERIRVQSTGNVGVGTTNPKRLFHLAENSLGTPSMLALDNPDTADGNGMSLSFRGTTAGSQTLSFHEFNAIQSVFDQHDYATSASSLRFYTSTSGYIAERMRISATGNIGIGNEAPSNALHVKAVANPLRLEGLQAGTGTDQILTVDASGVVRQQTTSSVLALNTWSLLGNAGTVDGTNFIGTTDNVPFNIRVNNQKAGRIDNAKGVTAFGYQSLNNNTGSNNNTAIGQQSMFSNTTGSNNTANGFLSLYNNTTGSNNTALGSYADVSEISLTNATAIGYNALVGSSNSMVLGGTGINQVSVGVGTTTPNSYLETAGSFATGIITITTNITLDKTHYTVIVTGGTPTITLPVAGADNNRRSYRIINQTSSVVTISSYIDFTGLPVLSMPGSSKLEVQSNGINWYRVD